MFDVTNIQTNTSALFKTVYIPRRTIFKKYLNKGTFRERAHIRKMGSVSLTALQQPPSHLILGVVMHGAVRI